MIKMLFRYTLTALLLSVSLAQQDYEANCFPALVASDVNGDGQLDQDTEFLAFTNAYGSSLYPDCYEPTDTLDLLLLGVYTTLSAESCLTCTPLPSCCFNLQLSIDGAGDAARTSEQLEALQIICDSTRTFILNCSSTENQPIIDVPDIDVPGIDVPDIDVPAIDVPVIDETSFDECLEKLADTDSNSDEIITNEEFSAAFTLPSNCSVADQGGFDLIRQGAYSSIVLSQCPLQDFLSCSFDANSRNISVSGLYTSGERTGNQTAALQTICSLTETIEQFSCAFGDIIDTPDLELTNCSQAVSAADTNGDGELSRDEYIVFLNDINDCAEEITELAIDQQATFASLACLSDLTEECLSNNSTTISLDNTTLTSICLSSNIFGCGELDIPGFPAPPVIGDDVNTNFSGCFDDIVAADENGDEFLSLDEFYALHVLRAGDRCEIASSITDTQRSTFEGLVCTSCISSGNDFSCCSDVSSDSLVSIAGAANRDDQTFIQTSILVAVCAAVELECIDISPTDIVPSAPTTESIPPPSSPVASPESDPGLQDCRGNMVEADADENNELSYSEFSVFVEIAGQEICSSISIPAGAIDLAFSTLGCSSCVQNGGNLDCCTEPVENKVIVIPDEMSDFLSAVCLTVNDLLQSSDCDSDGNPIQSPSLAPIATNNSSNPDPEVGGNDEGSSGTTSLEGLVRLLVSVCSILYLIW